VPILLGSLTVSSGLIYGSVLNLSFLFPHFNDPFSLDLSKTHPSHEYLFRVANTCFADNIAYLHI